MNALLGFLPFVAFAVLNDRLGAAAALGLAALIALAVAVKAMRTPPHGAPLFEAGVVVIFGGLAIWAWVTGSAMTLAAAHLFTKLGLLVLILAGMALGQPFTLAHARMQVDPTYADSPDLLRASQLIAGAWALAFVAMIAGDLVLLDHPAWPQALTFAVSLCGLAAAGAFTLWFADRAKQAT